MRFSPPPQESNAVAPVAAGIAWAFALLYSVETYGNLSLSQDWPLPEWGSG